MPVAKGIRVVGLPGSLRSASHTRKTVRIALEGAAAEGAETQLIDLREYVLPFCDGEEPEAGYGGDVERLRGEVRAAHGIILGSPEYHGAYSGVLKNALDLMGFDEFEGKAVGFVAVSGGRLAGTHAMDGLRTVCRSLHAWAIPDEAGVPKASRAFDAEERLTDERLAERVRGVGREVARFAHLRYQAPAEEFVEAWTKATPNPGAAKRRGGP